MNTSLDDLIPPDVPVRDTSGHIYCNKQCASDHGILIRDMHIIVFNEHYMVLPSGRSQATFLGFCAHCGTMI